MALATIISQYISAALVLLVPDAGQRVLHVDLRSLCFDLNVVKRILQVGLPAGFQGIVFSISNVVIQSSINGFGSTAIVAGSAAAANIEGFVYVGMNAFYQTAITFTSQNYGSLQMRPCKPDYGPVSHFQRQYWPHHGLGSVPSGPSSGLHLTPPAMRRLTPQA